ncbi:MAG TPA: ABC transporter ATP-binding protein [Gaiellaceae bacterium]|nr:ABC transporter ATP-binding protein [Gaiellaceae bacterium]
MRPGAIVAEQVSRRFRVHPQRHVTLKEAIVRRGEMGAFDIWALRDVSFVIEPGEAVGLMGRNGSGKTTLLRLIAGIFGPTSGRLEAGGTIGSLLGLGAGFHPEFTGRENVYLNGAIHGLGRAYIRERMDEIVAFAEIERFIDLPVRTYSSGMYMRLGFALATHLDADVILLDEVFAVGDEAFQRKCFGKIYEFKSRGGTIVFVSHSAAAVESLCERAILLRAGEVEFDGETNKAVARYHRLLAADEDPEEKKAGLHEWGSGEARVAELVLEDAEGAERRQYRSGEPFVARLRIERTDGLPPPRLTVEFRRQDGALVGAVEHDLAELGWEEPGAGRWIRLELERLPLADGRFQLGVALTDPERSRIYHHRERAAEFLVYPEDAMRGTVRFDAEWSALDAPGRVETA